MNEILLINERGPDFWNPSVLAEKTTYAAIEDHHERALSEKEFQSTLEALKGKRVLVLIHGLKNPRADLLSSYRAAHFNASQLSSTFNESYLNRVKRFVYDYLGFWEPDHIKPYDAVIGISWPSYDHETYYYKAKENARAVAPKVADHLHELTTLAKEVDVIAHSMGNLVLFEALATERESSIPLNHIFSIAAAVPQKSLNSNERYGSVASHCQKLFVLYSKNDEALGWPYYIAEGGKVALGLVGANHTFSMLSNVTSVDCSQIVKKHSDYFANHKFYKFIEKHHNGEYSGHQVYNNVKLDDSLKMSTQV